MGVELRDRVSETAPQPLFPAPNPFPFYMTKRVLLAGLVVLLCLAPHATAAYSQSGQAHGSKQAVASRAAPGEIRLDGRLDEEIWRRAAAVTDFVQKEPIEGAEPTERTEVRFAYTDDALYVGARMFSEGGPEAIQAPLGRRDNGHLAEHLLVSLDTYLDLRTAYTFGVTASGIRLDHYHRSDSETDIDTGFDPVWQAETQIDSEGWTAEMWIPFSQLRFSNLEEHTWGVNLDRWIPSKNEDLYWIPVPRAEQAWASRFGLLTGIRGIGVARRVEVLPYVLGGSTINGNRDRANPFDDGRNLETQIGGDLKVGLGPNLTLDATVLPDFGQVEVDPAVINLSPNETLFPERRPFFTEGSQLISGSIVNFFYSRRIGAPPAGRAAGDFVDYPQAAPILGAAKLTGRLQSGTSIGVLGAVTGAAHARTFDLESDVFGRVQVAPRSAWGVARVQQEVGGHGSTVSAMVIGVQRDLEKGQPLADLLTRRAVTLATENLWRIPGNTYQIGLSGGLTHVQGEEGAILRVQRASPRFFQRPDLEHVVLDPTRRSLSGYKASFQVAKVSGAHWLWDHFFDLESPGVEFNDVGRLFAGDGINIIQNLTYRELQPGRLLRNYRFSLNHNTEWNYGLVHRWSRLNGSSSVTFHNFWTATASTQVNFRGQEWQLTRGGPSMQSPFGWTSNVQLQNSGTSETRVSVGTRFGKDEVGGSSAGVEGTISMLPDPRLQISLNPSFTREIDARQYFIALPGGRPETFGGRYIFATIDRSTLALQARVNFTLRPDVNFELYAQPFASSGRYSDFGELEAARSRLLRIYGTDGTSIIATPSNTFEVRDGDDRFVLANRDFNVRSFRSTSVLRWEWRPGSTLSLVWQQDRSDREAIGRRADLDDLLASFGTVGNNYFAIKANYWLGR